MRCYHALRFRNLGYVWGNFEVATEILICCVYAGGLVGT